MIEIAPEEYHKKLTYTDAKLYCFSLNIDGKVGWRLPTQKEFFNNLNIYGWYADGAGERSDRLTNLGTIIPIRDLKDD